MNKGDIVYYARTLKTSDIYEILELKIRTVEDTWFVGSDVRTKQAFLFDNECINKIVFTERKDALKKVKAEEKNRRKLSEEKFYEEY